MSEGYEVSDRISRGCPTVGHPVLWTLGGLVAPCRMLAPTVEAVAEILR